MQQSNAIFAALFISFLIFVTLRGNLPVYMNLLRGVKPGQDFAGASGNGYSLSLPSLPSIPLPPPISPPSVDSGLPSFEELMNAVERGGY